MSCLFTSLLLPQAFTDHYYPTFDTNRAALSSLYSEQSALVFEGLKSQGTQAIMAKLTGLPFQRCQHKITSTDAHAVPGGGVLVFVTGQLLVKSQLYCCNTEQHDPWLTRMLLAAD